MVWWALGALLVLSGLISWFLTPVVLGYARRHRAFDTFDERKLHTRRVPRLGGVAIFSAVSLGLCAARLASYAGWISMYSSSSPSGYRSRRRYSSQQMVEHFWQYALALALSAEFFDAQPVM